MAGLYIHIPFCKIRCAYCDFYSQTRLDYINQYIQALVWELGIRKDYADGEIIETIYFGGGTPSLLRKGDFELIFNAINRFYTLSSNLEITLEANPEDISCEYLSIIRQLPFNRISIGIQSFHDRDLKLLKRRHTAKQALDAVTNCQQSGYSNLSIDLIYGIPGQTLRKWEENLDKALRLQLPHLSAYSLTYEEGTDLFRQLQAGTILSVSEENSIRLCNMLIDKLEANGYIYYEISNFCKPGCFSQHNTGYWTDQKYIGIGAAAHSYNHRSRQWNIASIIDYMEGIANGNPNFEIEIIDERMRYNDYILTHLRTMWGIPLSAFYDLFGNTRFDYLIRKSKTFLQTGLMEQDMAHLKITRQGLLLADGIIRELIENG